MGGDVTIATPPLWRVSWSCQRCGSTGWAQTKFPIEPTFQTAMGDAMLTQLKKYLAVKHQRTQGCSAIPDDFVITRGRE